jgi:membrane-associated phospholipid phosphatase
VLSRLPLPTDSPAPPTAANRAAVILFVLIPWVALYFGIQALGVPTNRMDVSFPFENRWPILQWTVAIYVSAYLQAPLAVMIAASQRGLRRFAFAGAIASALVGFCWIVIPAVVVHRPYTPHGFLGKVLTLERSLDAGTVSFPSMHVIWAFIAADVWVDRAVVTHKRFLRAVGWTWAVAIAITTITTGMHYLLDIFAAILVYGVVRNPDALVGTIRRATTIEDGRWKLKT